MGIRELVDSLSDAFVTYELLIRQRHLTRETPFTNKEKLIEILEQEGWNSVSAAEIESHLQPKHDLAECRALMIELVSLLMADQTWNGHAVDVRLKFLLPRINRIGATSNSNEWHLKCVMLDVAETLKNCLSKSSVQVYNPRSEGASNTSLAEPNYNSSRIIKVSVWKLGLKFSGDNLNESASKFLMNVEEYRKSRGVSEIKLQSFSGLLTGTATRTEPFSNWNDISQRFIKDYEPTHVSDKLFSTVKKRFQQPNESIVQYFAIMEDLFLRLPYGPFMQERIAIIQRNLLPHYVKALSTYSFTEVNSLKETCKRIESANANLQLRKDVRQNIPNAGSNVIPTSQSYPVYSEQNSNTRPPNYFRSQSSHWQVRPQQQNSISQNPSNTQPQHLRSHLQSCPQWQSKLQQSIQRPQQQPVLNRRSLQRPQPKLNNLRSNSNQKDKSAANNTNYSHNQIHSLRFNSMESSTIYPQNQIEHISTVEQPQLGNAIPNQKANIGISLLKSSKYRKTGAIPVYNKNLKK